MAPKSTVHKARLQISDMDRHYYASHDLVLAQHPSETDERLMLRLLAFALFADERLEFGRGLSTDDEPDLWRKDLTGLIEQALRDAVGAVGRDKGLVEVHAARVGGGMGAVAARVF